MLVVVVTGQGAIDFALTGAIFTLAHFAGRIRRGRIRHETVLAEEQR